MSNPFGLSEVVKMNRQWAGHKEGLRTKGLVPWAAHQFLWSHLCWLLSELWVRGNIDIQAHRGTNTLNNRPTGLTWKCCTHAGSASCLTKNADYWGTHMPAHTRLKTYWCSWISGCFAAWTVEMWNVSKYTDWAPCAWISRFMTKK